MEWEVVRLALIWVLGSTEREIGERLMKLKIILYIRGTAFCL